MNGSCTVIAIIVPHVATQIKINLHICFAVEAYSRVLFLPCRIYFSVDITINIGGVLVVVDSQLVNDTINEILINYERNGVTILTLISDLNWEIIFVQFKHWEITG